MASEQALAEFDLSTRGGRLRTYLDYLWNDHAYLRLRFTNAHWVSDELLRTNQPWPFQIRGWARKGIKTVMLDGSPEEGPADAIVTIVEYTNAVPAPINEGLIA